MSRKESIMNNVTGAEHAPKCLKKMLEACDHFPPDILGSDKRLEKERSVLGKEASSIGSIPLPTTIQGSVKKSFSKLISKNPEIFLDKLGERLAFERAGVRLYNLAIAKAKGLQEKKSLLNQLKHIRDEEAEHMTIIASALTRLGADPTAMTPAADLAGVLGQGMMQILSDPRTNMMQALDALLNAEAIDNKAWEFLIDLAEANGQHILVEHFENALMQEEEHLKIIRSLIQACLNE
jgi:ferritin-like protein